MNGRPSSKLKIRDLIAIGKAGEYIEKEEKDLVDTVPPPKDNPVPRLIAHIQQLIQETELAHKSKMERRKAKGKAGLLVTRLVLSEFSFYLKDYPLSLDQYKEIIAAIAFFAKKLPPNILLTLSSFPVLWPNEVLHNAAIHVQSPLKEGGTPILHHFDKRKPAKNDKRYFDYNKNKFYPLYGDTYVESDYYETTLSPNILLADTAISVNDSKQYRGTIKVIFEPQSRNKPEISILSVNELCIEHPRGMGIYNTNKLIKQLPLADEKVPEKASHVISSYSIDVHEDKLVGVLTQADPELPPPNRKSHTRLFPTNFGNDWHFFTCPSKEIGPLRNMNLRVGKQKTSSFPSNDFSSLIQTSLVSWINKLNNLSQDEWPRIEQTKKPEDSWLELEEMKKLADDKCLSDKDEKITNKNPGVY